CPQKISLLLARSKAYQIEPSLTEEDKSKNPPQSVVDAVEAARLAKENGASDALQADTLAFSGLAQYNRFDKSKFASDKERGEYLDGAWKRLESAMNLRPSAKEALDWHLGAAMVLYDLVEYVKPERKLEFAGLAIKQFKIVKSSKSAPLGT